MKPATVDEYIEQAPDFAKPILRHLRFLVHEVIPAPQESIKWGFPNFLSQGQMFCHMAAFKNHCSFGFWKGARLSDPFQILQKSEDSGMGHFGKIKSMTDLPENEIIKSYLLEAISLQARPTKTIQRPAKQQTKPLHLPVYLINELQKNRAAQMHFEKFSQSKQKDYIEWLEEAKTETTREKRLKTALEWIAEGKGRNWKYEKK